MKLKYILICVIVTLSILQCSAQVQQEPIVVRKEMGVVFYRNNKKLSPKLLMDITRGNSEAYKEMKIAKTNYDIGYVFGFAGGFLVGWPLGTAVAGGEANWSLFGVGAGLIAVSIPFTVAYSKHAQKAVKIHNDNLTQTGLNSLEYKIGLSNNGLGVRLLF